MHTIELLEQAEELARRLGYGVRPEWLGGCGGGACEIAGRKWIFVDLSLTTQEQLAQLTGALLTDPAVHAVAMPAGLAQYLGLRRAA